MDIKRIMLPVLFNTDATMQKKDAGIKVNRDEYEVRKVRFYSIDAICAESEDDKLTGNTEVYSCGTIFICNLTPEEVDKKIISLSYGENKQ